MTRRLATGSRGDWDENLSSWHDWQAATPVGARIRPILIVALNGWHWFARIDLRVRYGGLDLRRVLPHGGGGLGAMLFALLVFKCLTYCALRDASVGLPAMRSGVDAMATHRTRHEARRAAMGAIARRSSSFIPKFARAFAKPACKNVNKKTKSRRTPAELRARAFSFNPFFYFFGFCNVRAHVSRCPYDAYTRRLPPAAHFVPPLRRATRWTRGTDGLYHDTNVTALGSLSALALSRSAHSKVARQLARWTCGHQCGACWQEDAEASSNGMRPGAGVMSNGR